MTERNGEIMRNRALRARRHQWLGDPLDVDHRAPPVAAVGPLERHQRVDPVGPDELADVVRGIYALPETAVEGARELLPAL